MKTNTQFARILADNKSNKQNARIQACIKKQVIKFQGCLPMKSRKARQQLVKVQATKKQESKQANQENVCN